MRTVVPKKENEVFFKNFRVNAYLSLWNRLYTEKVGVNKCENYRNYSLTIQASKIITTIFYRRIEQTIESLLNEDQFDFMKKRGTREAL